MEMEPRIIRSSHALGMEPSTVRRSPRLRQKCGHRPEQAQQPVNSTTGADDAVQAASQGPLKLEAISKKALKLAGMIEACRVEKPLGRTLVQGNRSGTSQVCSVLPDGDAAGALVNRRKKRRFRHARAMGSRLQALNTERRVLGDEEMIRRDEAEGERYYFSHHVGIKFHDDPQDEGSKPDASPSFGSPADHCNFARVEEPKNRPSHYHCNWVAKKDLPSRGQMGKGMYSGYYVHVHDQIYFADQAGNKLWLVDDEGQAIFFQHPLR